MIFLRNTGIKLLPRKDIVIMVATCIIAILTYVGIQVVIILGLIDPNYNISIISSASSFLFVTLSAKLSFEYNKDMIKKKEMFQGKIEAISKSSIVLLFDPHGKIKSVNENFVKALGFSERNLVGKSHDTFFSCRSEKENDVWDRVLQGIRVKRNLEKINSKGNVVWMKCSYSPVILDENIIEVIMIAHDITNEYEKELDIINKNKYLEHSAKILRHDMNSGINIYMPRGLRSLERRLTPEQIKELKIEMPIKLIREGLKHTIRVYEGVKAFTNLVKEDSELEKEILSLDDILLDYFSSTSYSDQIAIGKLVCADVNESLFCTAIANLVSNGIEYNDSELKMVAITMIDDETLAVIDNGRGMSQQDFENLSKPYYRKTDQTEPGTGLGLNITVAILKEHGFDISVDKIDVGTMIKIKVVA